MSSALPLVIGDYYTRSDLVVEYGGAVSSGGIVASDTSNTVFVFADPEKSSQFGYVYDGFSPDGSIFYYTGAGPSGDQTTKGGNSSILTHATRNRRLHAFHAVGTVPGKQTRIHEYIGEFHLDAVTPYERHPGRGEDGKLRTVLVFRLRPVDSIPASVMESVGPSGVPRELRSFEVPREINSTEFFETSNRLGGLSIRRESTLVDRFISSQRGHEFTRWAIDIPSERTRLLTDVYDKTDKVLYEAKAFSNRSDIRMAVGQLYDYKRHVAVDNLRCSVLLPERPTADLRDYLEGVGLGLVFRDGEQFQFAAPARLTSMPTNR
ncbi:hypothetical protein [Microbacterium rhizophilus]|uniref:hypothetical protein n=1 Tax=Microbacterium rhizophilus TaxID=3138934 RepID=UPI0031EC0BF1